MQGLKIQLNYGTIAGLVGFVFFLLYFIINGNPYGNISWVSFWVPGLFMYLGTKKYKEELRDTPFRITYWRAFVICLSIAIIQASLYNMIVYLFGIFVNHSFVQTYINSVLDGLNKARHLISKDKLALIVSKIKDLKLSKLALGDFQNKIYGGVVVSLVLAAFLRQKKDPFQYQEMNESTNKTF